MLVSRIKASDGDRSPWGDFWFEPTASGTLSGMRVSPDTAMQLSAVYRAVGLVSGHMGMLPISFYRKGTRKRVKHPLLRILNVRPNRYQNAFEWREMVQGHLELRGNAYNEIISNLRGEITELMPLHPDKVTVEQKTNGDYHYRVTDPDGMQRIVQRGSMWHLRGLSSNGITGISVVQCARESFGSALAAQNYGARFFANDAKPSGGWISYPGGQFKDKEARQNFREAVQDAQSAANRGKLMLLDRGMQYHEVGINNSDAQFLESRKFSISDIARWFGIPPHKIGDLDKATFSNIEQQALEYMQDALMPRGARWEFSIEAELLFDDEDIDVEFEYKELLRGDSAARRAYYHGGILDGWLTRNEARLDEGREPLPGLDEPLRPLNMVEESQAEDEELDPETTEPKTTEDKEPKEPKEPGEAAKRLQALLHGSANRLARRFVKSGVSDADIPVISSALAISEDKAATFCAICAGTNLVDDEQTLTEMLIRLGEHK